MIVFVIKQLREKKKISQYRLSKITNISRTYIRNLENNKMRNPSVNILLSISEALNVNVKDLFYTIPDIENLRDEMHKRIDKYGLDSKKAMEISQIIDLLVNLKLYQKINEKTAHED